MAISTGNWSDSSPANDMWMFNVLNEEWSLIPTIDTQTPKNRSEATAIMYRDAMIVYGGLTVDIESQIPSDLNDIWKFDFNSKLWTRFALSKSTVTPISRFSHAAALLMSIATKTYNFNTIVVSHRKYSWQYRLHGDI